MALWTAGCDEPEPAEASMRFALAAPAADGLELRAVRRDGELVEIEVFDRTFDPALRGSTPTLFVGDEIVRAHRIAQLPSGVRLKFFVDADSFARMPHDAPIALRTQAGRTEPPAFGASAPRLSDVTMERGTR